ncbi:MAG: FtsX-like permease family protein, partial [Longimicrobiales bacterium]
QQLLARVRALPGVQTAGAVSSLPLVPVPEYYNSALEIAGAPEVAEAARPIGTVYLVTTGYFEAMRIPVLEGESLTNMAADARSGVFVSAALARRLFAGESAIGRRIRLADRDSVWDTIIGVVGDVPRRELAGDPAELLYVPISARSSTSHLTLAVRTDVQPATVANALRALVRRLDPDVPVANVRTMQHIADDSMARTRFAMATLLTAGALALFLGAVGIYGVIAYTISHRFHEIGVRMALGARAADIHTLILRRAAAVAFTGIVVGIAAAFGLTRFLRGLLFDVSPTDPLTLAAMAALLLAIVLLAAWIPARRVARTEPLVVLRLD